MASGDEAARNAWDTLYGLVLQQGIQAGALIIGGALAGAGKRQGVIYGAVVGVWNGVITVLVMSATFRTPTPVALFGQPLLQTALGALGGFLSSMIWKPLPQVFTPMVARRSSEVLLRPRSSSWFGGPVSWGRVLAGAAVATGGSIWANVILELVLESSEGKLTIDSHVQAQLVTWEITALAMVAGGALAGAATLNGLKQGIFVGLCAGAIYTGIRLGTSQVALQPLVFSVFAAIALGIVGGWFGGQLFPPIYGTTRGKHLGPAPL
jgi:hypothetical protein